MDAVQIANTAFAVDIFKKLAEKDKTSNIIFAPLCTSTSLALAYRAAKGETATQMKQGLHLEDVKDVPFGFQTITADASKLSSFYSLKMVKRLYVEKSLNPTTEFLSSIKRPFPSEFELADFKDKTEDTRLQINKSVSDLTDGKMENILIEGSVNDQTKILLINAAFFVTNWMKKFPENQTKEVKCLFFFIIITNNFACYPLLMAQDIEDDTTGLEQLEKQLTPEKMLQWTNPSSMANTKVNVFLPKFKMETEYDFKPILESLGMTHMFDESSSDFSEMSENKGVVLSRIIHKVSLEVVEDGTESRDVPGYRILQHKDEFNANHPFLFAFKHNKSRSIVFAGRFCSP
uniref:Serpin family B member 5 n=1 Tax=Anolis carolinensis TaxID=28377 RepID=H9GPF6_ANOCA